MVLDLIGDEGFDVLHEPDDELGDTVHDEASSHQTSEFQSEVIH